MPLTKEQLQLNAGTIIVGNKSDLLLRIQALELSNNNLIKSVKSFNKIMKLTII